MEMRLGQFQHRATGQRFLRFKLTTRRYYLPLGWQGWTVAKRISLIPDPLRRQLTLFNHRVKWNIADRWPTSWSSTTGDEGGGYDNAGEYSDHDTDEELSAEEDEDDLLDLGERRQRERRGDREGGQVERRWKGVEREGGMEAGVDGCCGRLRTQ
jgi:hypothetical protein